MWNLVRVIAVLSLSAIGSALLHDYDRNPYRPYPLWSPYIPERFQPPLRVYHTEQRFRRSPEPQFRVRDPYSFDYNRKVFDNGRTSVDARVGFQKYPGDAFRPSAGVTGEHKLFENEHGDISAYGRADKTYGRNLNQEYGIRAKFRFRRDLIPSVIFKHPEFLAKELEQRVDFE